MTKYLFRRIDIHYVEVVAESEDQAREEMNHVSCMHDRVDTEQGDWEMIGDYHV